MWIIGSCSPSDDGVRVNIPKSIIKAIREAIRGLIWTNILVHSPFKKNLPYGRVSPFNGL